MPNRQGRKARAFARGPGREFRKAAFPSTCSAPGCDDPIRVGDSIVSDPRRGGYMHPRCAHGGDGE